MLIVSSSSRLFKSIKERLDLDELLILASRKGTRDITIQDRDLSFIEEVPKEVKRAIIFTGITDIRKCEIEPKLAEKINTTYASKIIERLNSRNVDCLYISTSCVFSNNTEMKFENDQTEPSTQYGLTKMQAEKSILKYKRNSVLRISKVLSKQAGIIGNWKEKWATGKVVNAFQDVMVSPVSHNDVADSINRWVENKYYGILHLSSDKDISYLELAQAIGQKHGIPARLINGISYKDSEFAVYYNPKKATLGSTLEGSTNIPISEVINSL